MRARDSNNSDNIFEYLNVRKYSSGPNLETYVNLSFFSVIVKLHNTGTEAIKDFKILLDFEGDIQEIADTNESGGINHSSIHSNIHLDSRVKKVKVVPLKSVLVSDDTFCSDEIFIKPGHTTNKIIVKWRLLSNDFKKEGELIINFNVSIEIMEKEVNVPNSYITLDTYGEIEDFIVPKSHLE